MRERGFSFHIATNHGGVRPLQWLARMTGSRPATTTNVAALAASIALAWTLLGIANIFGVDIFETPATQAWPIRLWHHGVDLGRHVLFGTVLAALALFCMPRLPRPRLASYAVLAAVSVALGILLLPDDLANTAESIEEQYGGPATVVLWLLVAATALAIPALAVVARWTSSGWWRLIPAVIALATYVANNTVSPYDNSGAHFFLSCATATALAGAIAGVGAWVSARAARFGRWKRASLAACAFVWGLWAAFYPHPSFVLVDMSRWHGNLLVTELSLSWWDPTPAVEAGPFFIDRRRHAPVPPTKTLKLPERGIVILLTVDALRADVFTERKYWSYFPTLRRLKDRGAYFTNARSPGTQTVVTLASISTGKYFSQQYWTARPASRNHWMFDDRSAHFAEALTGAGVYTAFIPAARWMQSDRGLLRGFRQNKFGGRGQAWLTAKQITNRLLRTLQGHDRGPLFLFAHYLDSHSPYRAGGTRGTEFDRYLGAIAHVDEQIGRIVAAVTKRRLEGRTLFIVSSDHGEAFGEHSTKYHGTTLYEELLRIPLIFTGPGIPRKEIAELVSLIDLGPTILDLYGLPTPGEFMGETLLPLIAGKPHRYERPIVSETRLKRSMVFSNGKKAIWDERRKTTELYDLRTDPKELDNLVDSVDPKTEPHLRKLRAFVDVHTYRQNGYRPPYRK